VPDHEILSSDFLYWWLKTNKAYLQSLGRGATFKEVSKEIVESIEIPLPPLEEQRRIAVILDRVSFLLMRSDNACTLVDRLQESIFIHSFGEFGEAAARYPTLKLEDVCSLITDGEHQTPLRSDSGVKLLSARNIRNGKLDFSDVDFVPMEEFARIGRRCAPVRGDVLISCSGSIGRVAVVDTDEPLAMVRSAAMARPIQAKVRPFYLEILLRSRHLQQCMQKSANASSQANLFQGKIRALPVFLPSLEEQDAFVARASKARASAHILASRVIELQALMQSAQNAAFSGGIQQ
jgi:type I restriction enzyme S subunit